MSDSIEVVPLPLQTIVPCYPYEEYADDPNVVAFFMAVNKLAQGYLNWFNATPLGVYTAPTISGPLLDWIGNGIYGVPRPVFSTLASSFIAGTNYFPTNIIATDGYQFTQSGTAVLANDDYYKRVLTWYTYLGDGRFFNTSVLRRRVARFLFGANGGDVTLDQIQQVSIGYSGFANIANALITITIPGGTAAQYFVDAFEQGLLPFPQQLNAGVISQ